MLARSRALLIAMAAWNAYICRASRPQAPGMRPLRGRSTERTPISSPQAPPGTPGVYMGAKRRSEGCHSSSKRGAGPSVYHCGTSSSSRTQPSVCGYETQVAPGLAHGQPALPGGAGADAAGDERLGGGVPGEGGDDEVPVGAYEIDAASS